MVRLKCADVLNSTSAARINRRVSSLVLVRCDNSLLLPHYPVLREIWRTVCASTRVALRDVSVSLQSLVQFGLEPLRDTLRKATGFQLALGPAKSCQLVLWVPPRLEPDVFLIFAYIDSLSLTRSSVAPAAVSK